MAGDVSGSPALRPIPIDVIEKDDKFEIKVGNNTYSLLGSHSITDPMVYNCSADKGLGAELCNA